MVGGAPVTQEYADVVGADGYAADASAAVVRAKELLARRRAVAWPGPSRPGARQPGPATRNNRPGTGELRTATWTLSSGHALVS